MPKDPFFPEEDEMLQFFKDFFAPKKDDKEEK